MTENHSYEVTRCVMVSESPTCVLTCRSCLRSYEPLCFDVGVSRVADKRNTIGKDYGRLNVHR